MFRCETNNNSLGILFPELSSGNAFWASSPSLYHSYENPLEDAINVNGILQDDMHCSAVGNPSEITGQMLAHKMKSEKGQLEIPDIATLFDGLDELNMAQNVEKPESPLESINAFDQTQEQQMREIDDFIFRCNAESDIANINIPESCSSLSMDVLGEAQQEMLKSVEVNNLTNDECLSDLETKAVEALLDALLEDNSMSAASTPSGIAKDSGYETTGVSQHTTLNEESVKNDVSESVIILVDQVVDVIVDPVKLDQDSVTAALDRRSVALSPQSLAAEDNVNSVTCGNYWFSASPKAQHKPGRKPLERKKVIVEKRECKKPYTVAEKKERKRIQNVDAARKYRDKKNGEQRLIQYEEERVTKRNEELKQKCAQIENELVTLKKLMLELGLVKIISTQKIRKTNKFS